jgi:hypothetical protein
MVRRMKAVVFAACFIVIALVIRIDAGIAQQTTGSLPQVITGSSGVIILPRQAGSKDAPDIAPLIGPTFKLQSDRSSKPLQGQRRGKRR